MGGSISSETLSERHVIIVGGGYAGVELGTILLKWKVPFTLIDPKEYFYHIVGGLRALVDDGYSRKIMIPFKKTFGQSFLQGKVTNVDFERRLVSTDKGETLPYTDLVFAVGNSGSFFASNDDVTIESAKNTLADIKAEIDKASSVVIIGGGAVGVELAAELGQNHPAKKVTIIHSGKLLANPRLGEKFHQRVKSGLEWRNVEVLLEERVVNLSDLTFNKAQSQTVKTTKGTKVEADLVIKCIGLPPNISLTGKIFDESKFDAAHRLKVTPELNIEGESNIYAMGDCCNTAEDKLAAFCSAHAQTVAQNIWRSMASQPKIAYKKPFDGMVVTLGSDAGVGIINGWNLPSFACAYLKSKNLFTSKFWTLMGQSEPA